MPVLIYEGPSLNDMQRKEMIKGLTEVACNAMPDVPKQAFYVYLREYPDEKIGVGGCVLPEYLAELRNTESE
jgi:phenylpyruvate tautomerase PptA (4-oxalocrotonate tautomerase family)